jgi:hypothetical protein
MGRMACCNKAGVLYEAGLIEEEDFGSNKCPTLLPPLSRGCYYPRRAPHNHVLVIHRITVLGYGPPCMYTVLPLRAAIQCDNARYSCSTPTGAGLRSTLLYNRVTAWYSYSILYYNINTIQDYRPG